MRHEDPRNNPDYPYGDKILDYAERAERDAIANQALTAVGEIKSFLAAFALIKHLHDLFLAQHNDPKAVANAWLSGEGSTVSQTIRDKLESVNSPGLVTHLLAGLGRQSHRLYNVDFDALQPFQRLEALVTFLGLSIQDFERRTFEGIIKQSVVKDTAKKLEEGQGDYSKLL